MQTNPTCRWVYVKVGSNGEVAHLVAKGYTQIYGFYYCDTLFQVAKISIFLPFLLL